MLWRDSATTKSVRPTRTWGQVTKARDPKSRGNRIRSAPAPPSSIGWARNGITFTPREGKPVEINALWIHALRTLVDRAPRIAETIDAPGLAERAERSFRERFVRSNGALADRLAPGPRGAWTRVDEIRPNQLFAASLEFGPLDQKLRRAVVAECREHLLTPVGLRTLSPTDPAYLGRFEGDMMARDAAYHQGTVWPWLLGPFCEAHLRAEEFDAASKADVRAWLMPLLQSLSPDAAAPFTAIGQLSEVYDGDHPKGQPRRPGGCPAQAWSVAEVLRVLRLVW
jgi:glycogen debranching enzyme